MTEKNKIYLSLDDLHKLYGIAPDMILKQKKAKKKKNKKKAKKSTFGKGIVQQFGSGGGAGFGGVGISSSTIDRREIDILRGQLNEARNNPKNPANDGVLRLENVPEELKETFKFAKLANDGYATGNIKVSKSPAGNLIMGPTSQRQKQASRRRAIDISNAVDHTINEAPPLKSSNDLRLTNPLEQKSDRVEDVEDISLAPTTKLKPKTVKVVKNRFNIGQWNKENASARRETSGMGDEDFDADKMIKAREHHEKKLAQNALEGLYTNIEPNTYRMNQIRRQEIKYKTDDDLEEESKKQLDKKFKMKANRIKPPAKTPQKFSRPTLFTPKKQRIIGLDDFTDDSNDDVVPTYAVKTKPTAKSGSKDNAGFI